MVRTWVTALLVAGIVIGCSTEGPVQPQTAEVAPSFGNVVEKFTFAGVTLVDGDAVFENAVIEASSRDKGGAKQDFTNCSYYTEGYLEYLGQFGSPDFASHDAAAVQAFCEENFPNRQ